MIMMLLLLLLTIITTITIRHDIILLPSSCPPPLTSRIPSQCDGSPASICNGDQVLTALAFTGTVTDGVQSMFLISGVLLVLAYVILRLNR
jgi:hypothetical protein